MPRVAFPTPMMRAMASMQSNSDGLQKASGLRSVGRTAPTFRRVDPGRRRCANVFTHQQVQRFLSPRRSVGGPNRRRPMASWACGRDDRFASQSRPQAGLDELAHGEILRLPSCQPPSKLDQGVADRRIAEAIDTAIMRPFAALADPGQQSDVVGDLSAVAGIATNRGPPGPG